METITPSDVRCNASATGRPLAIVSAMLGLSITEFVRYRREPHYTYSLKANGRLINAGRIINIDSQTRFRRLILAHTSVHIPTFNRSTWEELINLLFSTVESVDVEGRTS